jgi:IS1 family transposase
MHKRRIHSSLFIGDNDDHISLTTTTLVIALLLLSIFSFSQTTIWLEDFTYYPDGTIQGSGTPPKWTRDVSDCNLTPPNDYFEVRSNQMEGRDLDGEAVWTSESIDISTYSQVYASTDVSMGGNMEPGDYIRFYYKIDGGTETLFSLNGNISNDFSPLVASQSGLSGNSLVIIVKVKNNGGSEIHRFDNMMVFEPLAGDFCTNAIQINEVSDLSFSTSSASSSGEKPGCGGAVNPFDLWYAYTATESGIATFDLCGSNFNTRLAVWDACYGNVIVCNDNSNSCGSGSLQSSISMEVISGTTYFVQIGGYDAITGNGDLSITVIPYPTNDNCANAISIGEVSDLPFTTITATASGVKPDCGGGTNPKDIWYAYTPTLSGVAAVDLCGSDYDTRLAIWNACNGTQIDCNDDSDYCGSGSLQSYLAIEVVAGVTYYLQVGGYNANEGSGDLSISIIPYPVNDDCSNAISIGEVSGLQYTTIGATAGGDNPGCGGSVNPVDIWYEYTATSSGFGSFSLCGSNFNTRLAIWDACNGSIINCNDNDSQCGSGSLQSFIGMDVVVGTTYYVQVGGNNSSTGSGQLSISVFQYPDNDDCSTATLVGEVSDLPFTTITATASGVKPTCGGVPNPIDLWYAYTPSSSGVASFDLCGSNYDTRLAIWNACNGTQIDCNDDDDFCGSGSLQSYLDIEVVKGVTYYVQVGGYNSVTGNGDLTISLSPYPVNNECTGAIAVGEVIGLPFTTGIASASGTNPGCGGTTDPIDIWYVYTPSSTGVAQFDLCNSNFDTRLAIWDACGGNVLACNNDDNFCYVGSNMSYLSINVSLGNTYLIQVGGKDDLIGSGFLTIGITPTTTGQWIGVIDSDWGTTGNWMDGTIPNASIDAQIINLPPNYPEIDETASCKNLLIDPGNQVTLNTGGNITLSESCWNNGILSVNDGSINITGNINCSSGSTTNISGGNITLNGWHENGPGTSASGKIELSGGTINVTSDASMNNTLSNSTMNGPFVMNIGGSIEMDASSFSEISAGTINLTGSGTVLPYSNNGTFEIFNLMVNTTGTYIFARDNNNSTFSIKNNFSVGNGIVQFLSNNGTGKPEDFIIGNDMILTVNAVVNTDVVSQIILTGDFTNNGIFNHNSGQIAFDGVTSITGSGTTNLNNVLINTGKSLSGPASVTLNISGDFINNGTYIHNNGTLIFSGTNQSIGGTSSVDFNNLAISAGSITTLSSPGNSLIGILKTDGTFDAAGNLTLISTNAQTALIDGSGSGNISGTVIMQQYLPSGFGYHYISSPFSSATVNQFSDEVDIGSSFPPLYYYNENKSSAGWENYSNPVNPLQPFHGYALNFGSIALPITVDMEGEVNNSSYSLTLYNNNQTYTQGFNLLGNPYPSPVNWDAPGWSHTNIDNAIYYFNPSTNDQYGGTYSSYVNGISSDGIANGIISSMQGFFVHVSDGSYPVTGNISINNNARVNSLTPVFHKNSRDDIIIRICAGFADRNTKCDPLVLYFFGNTIKKFDKQHDALKIENTDRNVPNIYGLTTDMRKLSVYSLPAVSDSCLLLVPVGLTTKIDGKLRLGLSGLENFPDDLILYLKDTETGKYYDLKKLEYPEFYLSSGIYNDRFYLIISKGEPYDMPDKTQIYYAFSHGNTISVYCESPHDIISKLEIINVTGHIVWQNNIHGSGLHRFSVHITPGLYIIKIKSIYGAYTRKIVLTN